MIHFVILNVSDHFERISALCLWTIHLHNLVMVRFWDIVFSCPVGCLLSLHDFIIIFSHNYIVDTGSLINVQFPTLCKSLWLVSGGDRYDMLLG